MRYGSLGEQTCILCTKRFDMMKIGLIDVDGKLPNLALMKISRYHKDRGDDVEWCDYISHYDIVYKAKIFTFTQDDTY